VLQKTFFPAFRRRDLMAAYGDVIGMMRSQIQPEPRRQMVNFV
jgi:hypothetical protein